MFIKLFQELASLRLHVLIINKVMPTQYLGHVSHPTKFIVKIWIKAAYTANNELRFFFISMLWESSKIINHLA